jgi:hypothetical protein
MPGPRQPERHPGLSVCGAEQSRRPSVIEPYQVVGLIPTMRGIRQRDEIGWNLDHIAHLIKAASGRSSLDLTVRLSAAQVLVSWSHAGWFPSEAALPPLAGTNPIPASSGQVIRHRPGPGATTDSSTAPCTPSCWCACVTTLTLAPTPPDAPPRATAAATPSGACGARSPSSCSCCLSATTNPASKSSEPLDIHSSLTPLTAPDVPQAGDVPTCTSCEIRATKPTTHRRRP